jgi:hypothetical protein
VYIELSSSQLFPITSPLRKHWDCGNSGMTEMASLLGYWGKLKLHSAVTRKQGKPKVPSAITGLLTFFYYYVSALCPGNAKNIC